MLDTKSVSHLDKTIIVKIADFGLSAFLSPGKHIKVRFFSLPLSWSMSLQAVGGSLNYMAPELLVDASTSAGPSIDVWSLGVQNRENLPLTY
jgi:serine/threonine protein kinase